MLDSIPEEVKQHIENDEDLLAYTLFPQAALSYFQKRRLRRRREETRPVGDAERKNLEEVAAILTAGAVHLRARFEAPVLVSRAKTSKLSPWVLATSRLRPGARGKMR